MQLSMPRHKPQRRQQLRLNNIMSKKARVAAARAAKRVRIEAAATTAAQAAFDARTPARVKAKAAAAATAASTMPVAQRSPPAKDPPKVTAELVGEKMGQAYTASVAATTQTCEDNKHLSDQEKFSTAVAMAEEDMAEWKESASSAFAGQVKIAGCSGGIS